MNISVITSPIQPGNLEQFGQLFVATMVSTRNTKTVKYNKQTNKHITINHIMKYLYNVILKWMWQQQFYSTNKGCKQTLTSSSAMAKRLHSACFVFD